MLNMHDHAIRKKQHLSLTEYAVLCEVYALCHNVKFGGWCIKSKENIAGALDCAERTVHRAIITLEEKSLLERNELGQLRTLDEFNNDVAMRLNGKQSATLGQNVIHHDKLSDDHDKMSVGLGQNVILDKHIDKHIENTNTKSTEKTSSTLVGNFVDQETRDVPRIDNNSPEEMIVYEDVQGMTKPITTEDLKWLIDNYNETVVFEIFDEMENWDAKKLKKKKSAKMTAVSWLARRGWKSIEKVKKMNTAEMREYIKTAPEQAKKLARIHNGVAYIKATT